MRQVSLSSHTDPASSAMRVVIILSVVAAIAAEAPYHLPQPGPQAPVFNYPVQQQQRPNYILNSQQSNNGYHYQQPQPRPIHVPQQRPQPQPIPQPLPQLQPNYPQPQPAPLPQPIAPAPQPLPQPSYGVPQPQPSYPQPQPSYPLPQPSYPQPQPSYPLPQPSYPQPQPSYPQPQPSYPQPQPSYPQPQPSHPQPQPSYPQPQPQPSYNYPQPQPVQHFPQPQPIQPLPQPQPQTILPPQPQSGYSYQQPAPLTQQSNQALSSYQADSNQYNNAQLSLGSASQYNSPQQQETHREALDDHVVSRVQSIIRDNEHSSARDRGYLSLVSGVSLENAQPSIEISSFVQNSPQVGSQSAVATDYELPSQSDSSIAFVPQNKPAISYGVPN